jgi:hypothetical protein
MEHHQKQPHKKEHLHQLILLDDEAKSQQNI